MAFCKPNSEIKRHYRNFGVKLSAEGSDIIVEMTYEKNSNDFGKYKGGLMPQTSSVIGKYKTSFMDLQMDEDTREVAQEAVSNILHDAVINNVKIDGKGIKEKNLTALDSRETFRKLVDLVQKEFSDVFEEHENKNGYEPYHFPKGGDDDGVDPSGCGDALSH